MENANASNTHHESTLAQHETTTHDRTTQHIVTTSIHRETAAPTHEIHRETFEPTTHEIHRETADPTPVFPKETTAPTPSTIQIHPETTQKHFATTGTESHEQDTTVKSGTSHSVLTTTIELETPSESTSTKNHESTSFQMPDRTSAIHNRETTAFISTTRKLETQPVPEKTSTVQQESTQTWPQTTPNVHHESSQAWPETTVGVKTTVIVKESTTTHGQSEPRTTTRLNADETTATLSPEELLITAAKPIEETTEGITDVPTTGCKSDSCQNGGSCNEHGACECTSHWTGDDCSVPLDIVIE